MGASLAESVGGSLVTARGPGGPQARGAGAWGQGGRGPRGAGRDSGYGVGDLRELGGLVPTVEGRRLVVRHAGPHLEAEGQAQELDRIWDFLWWLYLNVVCWLFVHLGGAGDGVHFAGVAGGGGVGGAQGARGGVGVLLGCTG